MLIWRRPFISHNNWRIPGLDVGVEFLGSIKGGKLDFSSDMSDMFDHDLLGNLAFRGFGNHFFDEQDVLVCKPFSADCVDYL